MFLFGMSRGFGLGFAGGSVGARRGVVLTWGRPDGRVGTARDGVSTLCLPMSVRIGAVGVTGDDGVAVRAAIAWSGSTYRPGLPSLTSNACRLPGRAWPCCPVGWEAVGLPDRERRPERSENRRRLGAVVTGTPGGKVLGLNLRVP